MIDTVALAAWLTVRAREPSTWRGIAGFFTLFGIAISPEHIMVIMNAGVAVVSLINIFKKDGGSF